MIEEYDEKIKGWDKKESLSHEANTNWDKFVNDTLSTAGNRNCRTFY